MDAPEMPVTVKVRESVLIVGGALMVIGSFSPWTYEGLQGPGATFFRNGMQLGSNRGFSLAGLLTAIFGALVTAGGATRLADKRVFRIIDLPPIVGGVVGTGVGLFGVGAAGWFTRQMTEGYPTLFRAGAGYGVWMVLGGGASVLIASISPSFIHKSNWSGVLASGAIVLAIALSAFALAPR